MTAPQSVRRSETAPQLNWLLRPGWGTVLVLMIWALAYGRVFVDHRPRVPLLFNWTPSLPYHVAWMAGPHAPYARGQFIVYAFAGAAERDYAGLRQQPFFKQVRGVPGDRVAVNGHLVFVNGILVGTAKAMTFDGRPLQPIRPGTIPPGQYFVAGTGTDSFDSRYAASGLVREDQILGEVRPWF